jgi:PHD/YefM family antitoxin component YafN of YafNO toxin-antitoxin module
MNTTLQYVADSEGQTVAVIVPIKIWQELLAERETAYLLSTETMKQRLLTAKNRHDSISFGEVCEKLGI